eukprot:Gb_24274 [translate_table: standard]
MLFSISYMVFAISAIYQCMVAEGAEKPGSSLTPSPSGQQQFWQSPGNTFKFGFHPSGSPGFYVVGISYASISETTLVWTAGGNGGIKVNDKASFHFQTDGNFVLQDGANRVAWQTNTGNKGVVSATMQDDGNFVVINNSSRTVWDTFSNPTDTLLVGQNLTVGKAIQMYPFSLTLESNGNLTLKWRNNITYWNEGASQGSKTLTASLDSEGTFTVSNTSATQLWFARSSDYTDSSVKLRRITMDSDGNLRSYGWHDSWQVGWSAVEDQCRVYGWCGNYGVCVYNDTGPYCLCPSADFIAVDPKDPAQGCKREQEIGDCSNNQTMVTLEHTEFLSYPPETESNSDHFFLGISDCRQNCLKSSTCIASTILSDGSGTCRMKIGNFTSAYKSPSIPSTSYVKVCGQGRPPAQGKSSSKVFGVGIAVAVIGTGVALIVIEICFWWICCKKNPRFRFGEIPDQYTLLEYASGAPVQFSYKQLQQSTGNFRQKVGSGGFGTVYKGTLPNRSIVAVKQLEGIEQGEKQFRMEVATIGSTHHLNLVRLIGFCSEGRHRLLVYEFMKNTSLDTFLFSSAEQSRTLDWDTRFGIALGTAKGITYLHEECRDCIVHCDIKPENILLDDNFHAKVSDFGLAKLINTRDHRNRTLTSVRGTRGYLAPEWLANLPITSKSDVFSYGMVLLEIVSGRRNFDITATPRRKKFPTWAFEEFEKGNILNIVDEKLGGCVNLNEVERTIRVSFWCIQEQPSQRPPMGRIVQMLEGILPIDKPPPPKSFEGLQSSVSSSTNSSTISGLASSALPVSSSSSVHVILSPNFEQNQGETLSSGR